jgi:galactokinase
MTEILPGAEFLSVAPGRVNLLGEHLDYNGGIVLPIAIDRYVQVAVKPSTDQHISIQALDLAQSIEFSLESIEQKVDIQGNILPGWAKFPAGVAWVLNRQGLKVTGMQAAFTSGVPIGAGLSSSAAVEVAFAGAWQALGDWSLDRMDLAKLCQQAENEFVGVDSGLMDQFASANGVDDHVLVFNTRNISWRTEPLPPGTVIAVADSGIRRALSQSGYNQRRQECDKAFQILRKKIPSIECLTDVTADELGKYEKFLPEPLRKRTLHVVGECHRVLHAIKALKKRDTATFGRLMFEGHASLRDLFEVSTPELDALVDIAGTLPGCYGARLTGAGFGGCTVNLVANEWASLFVTDLKDAYQKQTGRQAKVYLCRASRGLNVLKL